MNKIVKVRKNLYWYRGLNIRKKAERFWIIQDEDGKISAFARTRRILCMIIDAWTRLGLIK